MTTEPHPQIGVAGRTVYRLGFGAGSILPAADSGAAWLSYRRQTCALLRRAVELGVQFIDTADSYGEGASEQLVAEALHPYPSGMLIATKGGFVMTPESWTPNGRPEWLKRTCEQSLARLRVERIGLYQLHAPDPAVPFDETLGALIDLRQAGKIGHIGLSNVTEHHLQQALALTPIASVQNRYNLRDRSCEAVLELCTTHDIAFIPWSPTKTGVDQALAEVATEHKATPTQIALAWLLNRAPLILPIPSTSSIAHLEENMAAANLQLSPKQVQRLEEEIA
jgi:pyridoxine 4-dehydrogenase